MPVAPLSVGSSGANELLGTIFAGAHDDILLVDQDYCIEFINRTWEGYTFADVLGTNCLEALPDAARQTRRAALEHVFTTGEATTREIFANNRWYRDRITPIYQDGIITKVVIHATDVTAEKQAQAQLDDSVSFISLVLESNPHYIYWKDSNFVLIGCNRNFANAVGFAEPGEIVGKTDAELPWPQETQELNRQQDQMVFESKQPLLNIIQQLTRADGQVVMINLSKFPLRDRDGNVVGVLSFSQDITEQKQVEQELRQYQNQLEELVKNRTEALNTRVDEIQLLNSGMLNLLEDLQATNYLLEKAKRELEISNEELESFSYSVSHDLRAPIRHINGFVQMLRMKQKEHLDETSERYIQNIVDSSAKMSVLIDDLLHFSRTSRTELQKEPVNLNELVASIKRTVAQDINQYTIEWEIDTLPTVDADASMLQVVMQNLLENAVKYSAIRPVIKIQIRHQQIEGHDIFSVTDNGVGFDPQFSEKLFGVFQRLHRNEDFIGTGIGLATVRRVIHRHGGQVWAKGELDKGSTFYFSLSPIGHEIKSRL